MEISRNKMTKTMTDINLRYRGTVPCCQQLVRRKTMRFFGPKSQDMETSIWPSVRLTTETTRSVYLTLMLRRRSDNGWVDLESRLDSKSHNCLFFKTLRDIVFTDLSAGPP